MKIVFLDAKTLGHDLKLDRLKELGHFTAYANTITDDDFEMRTKDADVIITNKVVLNKKRIDLLNNCSLICEAATGLDNIDVEYANSKSIVVKNVKGYSTHSVAQHTFALLFHLIHQNSYYQDFTQTHKWIASDIFTHLDRPYFEIKNKKWGIIGLGEIGKTVATIAQCFGAKVSYYSTSGLNKNDNFEQVSLDQLCQESDIISIHAPLNDQTLNLINENRLKMMKDDVFLLNLGRGPIINEKDLVEKVKSSQIRVALDVISKEPMDESCALKSILTPEYSSRVFITPHIAWASIEARNKLLGQIYDHIKNFAP